MDEGNYHPLGVVCNHTCNTNNKNNNIIDKSLILKFIGWPTAIGDIVLPLFCSLFSLSLSVYLFHFHYQPIAFQPWLLPSVAFSLCLPLPLPLILFMFTSSSALLFFAVAAFLSFSPRIMINLDTRNTNSVQANEFIDALAQLVQLIFIRCPF